MLVREDGRPLTGWRAVVVLLALAIAVYNLAALAKDFAPLVIVIVLLVCADYLRKIHDRLGELVSIAKNHDAAGGSLDGSQNS